MSTKTGGIVFIAIGSLIAFATVLFVVGRMTGNSELSCPSDLEKCNDRNKLYHLQSQQCLQNGEANGDICGSNMVISPLTTCSIQGDCECDYENHERHLVYDDTTDQCYPIYSQGPCDEGYVVTVSSNGKTLNCKHDACLEAKLNATKVERDSIVPYKNKCHLLSTELDEPGCKGELKFWKNQLHPSCSPPPVQELHFSGFFFSKCQPGSHQSYRGFCQPSISSNYFQWRRINATFNLDDEIY